MADPEPEEAPPQMQGPPREDPGFPALPWAAGGVAELLGSCSPNRMFQMSVGLRDALSASSVGMINGGQAGGQVGLQYSSALGLLKAELASAGMWNISLEGFQPLPFAQLNTQLAFVGGMLAGGQVHSIVMTPVGVLMGAANVYGQMSGEIFTGLAPAEGHQIMLGAHCWGLPGVYGGIKAAIEWTRDVTVGEEVTSQCSITAAVMAPHMTNDGSPGQPTYTFSVCNRGEMQSVLQFESGAAGSTLTVGGAIALSEMQRLKARWATNGLLGVALDVAGEKSAVTFCGEVNSTPGKQLNPKFGVTLMMGI